MPARRPHEAGLQAAGDPPTFESYSAKPESEWHAAQDAWLAAFSEGKSTLPLPGESGSTASKARAQAWRSAIKRHGRAKRMSLAEAGDTDAAAILDADSDRKLFCMQQKKPKHCDDGSLWHARPRGSAPNGYSWDHRRGKWLDDDGDQRPTATRNQRRVEQRDASAIQTARHKHKWALYDSMERRRKRRKGELPAFTVQERKVYNAAWRLGAPAEAYAAMGYDRDADVALARSMGDVVGAARQREADARAAAERERAEREAAYRAAKERETERLAIESRAPARLEEGKRLAEGFSTGGRVEFRTLLTFNLKTGKDLEVPIHTDWQPGTLTKVVADGHVKSAYGVAWLEVRPDGPIPGYYLRRGESYVISLRANKRASAGVYERVRVLNAS